MGSNQSTPVAQAGAASQSGSPSAESSNSKQVLGVVLFIVSIAMLSFASGVGIGKFLSTNERMASFIAAVMAILVGLYCFGVL